jgi:DNA-binding transcriptional LysR family regulator
MVGLSASWTALRKLGRLFHKLERLICKLAHLIRKLAHLIRKLAHLIRKLDGSSQVETLGFRSSLAGYTLPTAISAFRERYPDVKLQLNQGSYLFLIEGVVKGNFNRALLGSKTGKVDYRKDVIYGKYCRTAAAESSPCRQTHVG